MQVTKKNSLQSAPKKLTPRTHATFSIQDGNPHLLPELQDINRIHLPFAMGMPKIKEFVDVNGKGVVQNVSFGTPMGPTKEFYKAIKLTAMPYGQAMTLLCVVERIRAFL